MACNFCMNKILLVGGRRQSFLLLNPLKTIGVLFMAIFAISAPTSKKKKCWENPTLSLVVKNGKLFGGSSYPYLLTFCFVRPIIKRQFLRFYCIAGFYVFLAGIDKY